MAQKIKVLFVCVHNSARSQMAEAFLNNLAGNKFEAKSAGITPAKLNPVVVDVMKEMGIDISGNKTKGVKEFIDIVNMFDYVITVCDGSGCPLLPGNVKQMHWSFPDPSEFTGTNEDKLAKTREVRGQIKSKIEDWIKNFREI
ncbi:MAG: arsenate reductase ArsC [Elusimicrobia bacterium]|nr:arsenate reductase ArsC [Elusimicrobiota bacterium]